MGKLTITPAELAANQEGYMIIDVRNGDEVITGGRIAGSIHIPASEILANIPGFPLDIPLVFHCVSGGGRSVKVVNALIEKGYGNVMSLEGGIEGWKAAGLPVEVKNEE